LRASTSWQPLTQHALQAMTTLTATMILAMTTHMTIAMMTAIAMIVSGHDYARDHVREAGQDHI